MRRMIKRLLGILLIVCLLIATEACGSQADTKKAGEAFDWKVMEGSKITVSFTDHPYAKAIIGKLPEFEEVTGIKVDYSIIPESNYYDKLSNSLLSATSDPDVFMLGPTSVWEYAPAGYLQPLDNLISDKKVNDPNYDWNDFFPNVVNTFKWDGVYGHSLGTGSLWGIPMGCEVYNLMYNKRIFEEKGLEPPKTVDDLLRLCTELNEFDGEGTYALALRGAREWPTVYTGYMTMYTMYGGKDFVIEEGQLISQVNSPQAVEMTEMWVELIKNGGAPGWSGYTWYQAGADLGAGKAAMLFDADNVGYYQNIEGASQEYGNIAWTTAPLPFGKENVSSNFWCWALAINNASDSKEAAWIFMQYFTSKKHLLWAAVNAMQFDPVRKSVMDHPDFKKIINQAEGYEDAFNNTIEHAFIHLIPHPYFAECSTEWAATIQDIVAGEYTAQQGMDMLARKFDAIVSDVVVD